MKKFLKVIGYVFLTGVLAIALLVGALLISAARQRSKFIKETVAILSTAHSLADIRKLDAGYRPDFIYTRQFENGKWAAVRALDEDETEFVFTAAIIYTGEGVFWISRYPFCGYEGLSGGLNGIEAVTLDDFISKVCGKYRFSKFK